jgi:hypothetical protein
MKLLLLFVLLFAFGLAVGCLFASRLQRIARPATTGPVLQGIQEIGSLLTLQTTVVDVHTSELAGYTGSVRVVILVKGDVQLACPVDDARFENVDEESRQAVLVLKPPVASRPRLDHDRTRLWALDRTGLWQLMPGHAQEAELVSNALQEAQHVVADAVVSQDLDRQARERAEALLTGFFKALNWNVTVRWTDRDDPAP